MQNVIKVLGVIALIWIAFTVVGWVLGWVFKLILALLVVGAVLFVGSAAYAAVRSRSHRGTLPR
jgi:hypothetical protein